MDKYFLHSIVEASNFRKLFSLSKDEPFDTETFLRKNVSLTIFTPFSNPLSGMAIKTNKHKFIAVNSNDTKGKQNFTICHELYHLFIQKEFSSMICQTGIYDKQNKIEYEADSFASELLIPTIELFNLIPENKRKNNINLFDIVRIEQHFKCSRTALLVKLIKLGFIAKEKFKEYRKGVINSALFYGFDEDLYKKGDKCFVIGDYAARAYKLFEEEKISESHYYNLMKDIKAESIVTKDLVNDFESG